MSVKVALLLSLGVVAGCTATSFPLADRASEEGLGYQQVLTPTFEHAVYRKGGGSAYQVVFIEGDGRPWASGGTLPSQDPTPRVALAFELMLSTPAEAIYVTRPCYFETRGQACSPSAWTSGRFSAEVVASLADAVRIATDPDRPVIVVGYSGGGALALLIAERLDRVDGVVTVAGLLDSDSWTEHHGYEHLSESINPASRSPGVPRLHLHGVDDTVIPIELVYAAVADRPGATLAAYADYGHVCCWRRDWAQIWKDVELALGLGDYEQSDSSSASQ